ncbi:hypothetical protein LJC36_06060, partial [Desulfovibrio sp. OttesenSCG-928-C14]|nr:hypothetical protein [Desulfovibrio sp. OttesenSCG-928-C14]
MSTFKKALESSIEKILDSGAHYRDNNPKYLLKGDPKYIDYDAHLYRSKRLASLRDLDEEQRIKLNCISDSWAGLFELLADRHSKQTLLTRALYLILGHIYVKFDYSSGYLEKLAALHQAALSEDPDLDPSLEEILNWSSFPSPNFFYDLNPLE